MQVCEPGLVLACACWILHLHVYTCMCLYAAHMWFKLPKVGLVCMCIDDDNAKLKPGQQGWVNIQGRGHAGKVGRGQHVMCMLIPVCACLVGVALCFKLPKVGSLVLAHAFSARACLYLHAPVCWGWGCVWSCPR
jgi:hypothetical protein